MSETTAETFKRTLEADFIVRTVSKRPDTWLIKCRICDAAWNLPKSNKHSGNILHLLNHAASHQEDE